LRFYSDNTGTACPEMLVAIAQANSKLVKAYGEDPWTERLDGVFGEFFGTPVRVFPVSTGTAANSLSLATITPPYGAVFAHEWSHVVRDECGAPEFFTGGARLVHVPGRHGRINTETLAAAIESNPPSVHTVQPAALTLTQATEFGTAYQPDDVAVLSELAKRHRLKVHMDGARLANALASLNCHPSEITWRAGVDVLSFGATKNGGIAAEAVVFFDRALVRDFEFRRKRAGHLLSKSRYVSAQLIAYIETGVWRRNAVRANKLAQRVALAAGPRLMHPVEANEIFVKLGDAGKRRLREAGFEFYDWGSERSGEARFVVSWDQPEREVAALSEALSRLQQPVNIVS
jgi:threonine aldolase